MREPIWCAHILFVYLLTIPLGSSVVSSSDIITCGPLNIYRHIDVSCYAKDGNSTQPTDCTSSQSPGTVAKFRCEPYYVTFDLKGQGSADSNEIKCNGQGEWVGLRRYESFRCKEDCGRLRGNAKPLVIHGKAANRTSWPWHATIFRKEGKGWHYICGGSLIRNQIVLTAAHCFSFQQSSVGKFQVVLGAVSSNYVDNVVDPVAQIHSVSKIFVSENYNPANGFQADIAVAQLKDSVKFSDYVIPVCLPSDYTIDLNAVKSGSKGQVAGFGITETGKVSRFLRSVDLSVRSNSECYNSLKRVLSESQFCAGSREENKWYTLCNGDSGGGLCFPSPVLEKYHIHGLVSSGDPNTDRGVCQNFAVFTRIYPFIFWIRDLVEEISGEIARDLQQAVPYPYALRGTETQLEHFSGLPEEWENRVTSLEVQHASVVPDQALSSLQFAKPLTSLKFGNIVLDNKGVFESRIVLPILSSFSMDVLNNGFRLREDRTFPVNLTEDYIKSWLFFDKDYSSDHDLTDILEQNTDVDLSLHIFKLVHLDFGNGELYLSQIQTCNQIFYGLTQNTEIVLRSLSLSRCAFNLSETESLTVSQLTLDSVNLLMSGTELSTTLKAFKSLVYLTLKIQPTPNLNKFIRMTDLSPKLMHLSLSSPLQLEAEKSQQGLPKLETFCCDYCHLPLNMSAQFQKLFPRLKRLMLITDQKLDLKPLMNMPTVSSIYLESSESAKLSNFEGLNLRGPTSAFVFLQRSTNGNWTNLYISTGRRHNILYTCRGQHYFWTSEEDYRTLQRLKTFEKSAINTNAYTFTGQKAGGSLEKFLGVPAQVQTDLRSISLTGISVTPKVVFDSVRNATSLESLSLTNTTLDFGSHTYRLIQSKSLELKTETLRIGQWDLELIQEIVNGKLEAISIPFQHIGSFSSRNGSNPIQRLLLHLNCIRLKEGSTRIYILDTPLSEIRAFGTHLLELISRIKGSHPLQGMAVSLANLHSTYREGVLPPEWNFSGLHVIDKRLVESFFKDDVSRIIGNLGILDYLLKRFGKLVTVNRSTSLSLLKQEKNPLGFPPLQAVSVSINEDSIE